MATGTTSLHSRALINFTHTLDPEYTPVSAVCVRLAYRSTSTLASIWQYTNWTTSSSSIVTISKIGLSKASYIVKMQYYWITASGWTAQYDSSSNYGETDTTTLSADLLFGWSLRPGGRVARDTYLNCIQSGGAVFYTGGVAHRVELVVGSGAITFMVAGSGNSWTGPYAETTTVDGVYPFQPVFIWCNEVLSAYSSYETLMRYDSPDTAYQLITTYMTGVNTGCFTCGVSSLSEVNSSAENDDTTMCCIWVSAPRFYLYNSTYSTYLTMITPSSAVKGRYISHKSPSEIDVTNSSDYKSSGSRISFTADGSTITDATVYMYVAIAPGYTPPWVGRSEISQPSEFWQFAGIDNSNNKWYCIGTDSYSTTATSQTTAHRYVGYYISNWASSVQAAGQAAGFTDAEQLISELVPARSFINYTSSSGVVARIPLCEEEDYPSAWTFTSSSGSQKTGAYVPFSTYLQAAADYDLEDCYTVLLLITNNNNFPVKVTIEGEITWSDGPTTDLGSIRLMNAGEQLELKYSSDYQIYDAWCDAVFSEPNYKSIAACTQI